jgi:hypothetical protein
MTSQVMQVPDSVANPNSDATAKLLSKVPTGLLIGDKFVDGSTVKCSQKLLMLELQTYKKL